LIVTLGFSSAHAESAPELVKQGLAAYKAGDYAGAVTALARANELEPNSDTLFALAQAERLAGHCDAAIPHYRALLDASTDMSTARLIEASVAMCPTAPVEQPKPPEPAPPPPAPPPAPAPIVREGHTSLLTMSLLAGGGLAAGVSLGLFLASNASSGDANAAATFADHERISTRADREQVAAYVTLAASVGMVGAAIFRMRRESHATEVVIAPSKAGAVMSIAGSW
jgi:tetratricopeptide (TPR) repeat protein